MTLRVLLHPMTSRVNKPKCPINMDIFCVCFDPKN
jgi:hypothetical protein